MIRFVTVLGFICCLFFVSNSFCVNAQPAPKVGLVLSGGGAKGLAHIGLLRMIDSLQIKVDYITGTSMGSIIGGLYAIGYSGDSIKSIIRSASWRRALSNRVDLNQVNIEEKSEYHRYMVEVPATRLKPVIPLGVFEGQALSEMLNSLILPQQLPSDFSKFPIPFKCIATDIRTGEKVILQSGSLAEAIRASMAIPTVFTPVKIDKYLLVDGGLSRNMPVDEVKSMGAEYVIGSYTGFRVYNEEELTDAIRFLYQTQALSMVEDSKAQSAKTDLLIDLNDYLADFGAGDFHQFEKIIAAGEQAAQKALPELEKIAELQRKAGITRQYNQAKAVQHVMVDTVIYDKVNGDLLKLVTHRTRLKPHNAYSINKLNRSINYIYGTRFFEKVTYSIASMSGDTTNEMIIHLKPANPEYFKVGVHFDTERSAGVILNYTIRNFFLDASRAFVKVDASDLPKFRFNYYKLFGKEMNWWVTTDFFYEFNRISLYNHGSYSQELNESYLNASVGIQKSLGNALRTGVSGQYEFIYIKPKADPAGLIFPPAESIRYKFQNRYSVVTDIEHNTMQSPFFSRKGTHTYLQLRYDFYSMYNAGIYQRNDQYTTGITQKYEGRAPQSVRLLLNHRYAIPISDKLTLSGYFFAGTHLFSDSLNSNLNSGLNFYAGGIEWNHRACMLPMVGYRLTELSYNTLASSSIGLQYELTNKIYVTPQVAVLAGGDEAKRFIPEFFPFNFGLNQQRPVFHHLGYGLTIGYDSMLGPVTVSFSDNISTEVFSVYFSLGYKF